MKCATKLYNEWKGRLPIECLLNVVLLYQRVRLVVQIDSTYYTEEARNDIERFICQCEGLVVRSDALCNRILYLERNKDDVERRLKAFGDGASVESGFRTSKFADMLDPTFYQCKGPFPHVFCTPRIVQVSMNVIADSVSGPILVQMCHTDIETYTQSLYEHFLRLSTIIETIDPSLQTTLTFHTKPGVWKDSTEYIVDRYRALPPLNDCGPMRTEQRAHQAPPLQTESTVPSSSTLHSS